MEWTTMKHRGQIGHHRFWQNLRYIQISVWNLDHALTELVCIPGPTMKTNFLWPKVVTIRKEQKQKTFDPWTVHVWKILWWTTTTEKSFRDCFEKYRDVWCDVLDWWMSTCTWRRSQKIQNREVKSCTSLSLLISTVASMNFRDH